MKQGYSSGDLARATGTTIRAIRFYEEEGLLEPVGGPPGRRRRYGEPDLERLRLISDLREFGLPICEVRSVLALRGGCRTAGEFAARFRELVTVQLGETRKRMATLRRLRREMTESLALLEQQHLDDAAACPCTVAGTAQATRLVRVLAGHDGSCGAVAAAGGAGAAEAARGGSLRPRML